MDNFIIFPTIKTPEILSLIHIYVLREPGVQIALFFEDTAAYTSDRNANKPFIDIQRQLDAFVNCPDNWKFVVSETKSSTVLFSKRR